MDYIFGYGSIINDASRIATSSTACPNSSQSRKGTLSTEDKADTATGDGTADTDIDTDTETNSGGSQDLAVAAHICPHFARRVWNFRCPTGFTALGITLSDENNLSISNGADDCGNENSNIVPPGKGINGVLFPITSHQALTAFDIREIGYTRIAIPLNKIHILLDNGCLAAQDRAVTLQSNITEAITSSCTSQDNTKQSIPSTAPRIWMYVPDSSHTASPSVEFPILQTYVDVCIEGCLQWGGEEFAIDFLRATSNWSEFYLNDTPLSRRPWLHRKDYKRIDSCLQSASSDILFACRKHPDEFASLHLTSLKGMFGVPPRNRTFIGRESFLQAVHVKLSDVVSDSEAEPEAETETETESICNTEESPIQYQSQSTSHEAPFTSASVRSSSSSMLKQVEISGIGGVGKSQIAIEYAHRYYSASCYALVAWFRAESAASIATDMRKLAFDLGIIQDGHRTAARVTGTPARVGGDDGDTGGMGCGNDPGLSLVAKGEGVTDTAKDLEEYDDVYIINELMRRLGLCRFKWLFIFDNLDDPSILPAYLPRGMGGGSGIGCGHVVVTSRIQHYDWMLRGSSLTLDCFDTLDSVRYVKHTLGILYSQNNTNLENSNETTLQQLCVRMGNLPLALSIAVAYMVRCDVSPVDYLNHVNNSSGGNLDAISTSLNVTLKRIGEECLSAATILPCLGYFAPDKISKDIIQLFLLSAYYHEDGPQPEIEEVVVKEHAHIQQPRDLPLTRTQNEQNEQHDDDSTGDRRNKNNINYKQHNKVVNIMELKCLIHIVVMVSVAWVGVLIKGMRSGEAIATILPNFVTGIVTGCVLVIDVIALFFWLQPQYRLYIEMKEMKFARSNPTVMSSASASPLSVQTTSPLSSLPSSEDTRGAVRFTRCVAMIDARHACEIGSVITAETDTVWEIMKQFSLLSIRGGKGHGCVHRLQQVVLRSAHDVVNDTSNDTDTATSDTIEQGIACHKDGLYQKVLCMERCIWVLSKLWKFNKNDSLSWQKAGDIIEHIQVIAKHAMDTLPTEDKDVKTNDKDKKRKPSIRVEYYLLLSVLLKEGGVYISMVLSRFDSAQQLLEWSHHIQTYLLQGLLPSPSSQECTSQGFAPGLGLEMNFKGQFLEKLNDCLAATLYILGKVLRYNDQLVESEFMLKQSLALRKNNRTDNYVSSAVTDHLTTKNTPTSTPPTLPITPPTTPTTPTNNNNNGASADILHELGVLYLRKHDLYTAKSYLTRSLHMKYDFANEIQETDASSTLHQLGVVATLERRYDDAESLLLQALDFQDFQVSTDTDVFKSNHNSSRSMSSSEKDTNIKSHSSSSSSSRNMTSRAATLQQLGRVELRRGRLSQADVFLSEALEIYMVAYGDTRAASHVNVAGVRHQLGAAAMASKDYDRACEHFSIALAAREIICSQSSGGKDQVTAELLALGQGEVERGRYTVADTLFLRAKSSLEMDLSCSPSDEGAEKNTSESNLTHKGVHNYSSIMLTKCGYGQDGQEHVQDKASYERKRDALIKQLFFCVHLLRSVARQRGDAEATVLYSAELKGLSMKYPSHRQQHAKKHDHNQHEIQGEDSKSVLSATTSNPTPTSESKAKPKHHSTTAASGTSDVFQSDFNIDTNNQEENNIQSHCRSQLCLDHTHVDGDGGGDRTLPLASEMLDTIRRLVVVRCNIRQQCKAIQTQAHILLNTPEKHDHALYYYDILSVVCNNLREALSQLQGQPHDANRINLTLQTFITAVESKSKDSSTCAGAGAGTSSCSSAGISSMDPSPPLTSSYDDKKMCLSMLYQLSDDLRKDIRTYGFRIEDL